MTNPEVLRVARLEAVAAVRAHTDNDQSRADLIVDDTEDPVELARAAVGFAACLLLVMPASTRQPILDGLLGAAVTDPTSVVGPVVPPSDSRTEWNVDDGPAST